MTVRLAVGVFAVVSTSACGLLAALTDYEIADKVNEKVPQAGQFGWTDWRRLKSGQFEREYRSLYPSGRLVLRLRLLYVLGLASLLIGAWAFGIFSAL
jgi:hypothetical protein